ncbi:LysR family transcriptional regulator [Shewanella intestini]|uniref:LysR family transcriptional regulator n=1 Tax=Shewanella intestini TaxID=2017544 RepID=A0ABS5I5E6_9GAMM|nr:MULTISPECIES: LysR family transcriptional regulator [Shewanella]MBR9729248.1 LysR family transcriptional regulator [Shewanella intestini]MRG35393.1 LysR family transcriptional regulator [Shewanella sp. XMDDZSB0408]
MLTPNYLVTFIKLVEVGHFGQTAEQLYMTQPGVTQHIKKLEQQVGMALINRIGKRFELTHEGDKLYRYAKELVKQQADFLEQLSQDNPMKGLCKVACSGSLAMLLYPQLVAHQQQFPQLTISLEAAPNQRIIESVLSNEIDIGVITQQVSHPALNISVLGKQKLCLVLPQYCAQMPISIDSLHHIGMINHPDGKHYWHQLSGHYFSTQLAQANQVPITGYVNQLNHILLPVSKGLGFTVLPEFAVLHSPFLQKVHIASGLGTDDNLEYVAEPLLLIHKNARELPARYQAIIDIINACV